jgi:hypothetical protein
MSDTKKGIPTKVPSADAMIEELLGGGAGTAPTLEQPAGTAAESTAVLAGPTLAAPAVAATVDGITAATWKSGQVTALWSIEDTRNAWMQVSGVGWRKLYNGRDFAFTALVILASQARQTGKTIQFREEADGMVYEIYLW